MRLLSSFFFFFGGLTETLFGDTPSFFGLASQLIIKLLLAEGLGFLLQN